MTRQPVPTVRNSANGATCPDARRIPGGSDAIVGRKPRKNVAGPDTATPDTSNVSDATRTVVETYTDTDGTPRTFVDTYRTDEPESVVGSGMFTAVSAPEPAPVPAVPAFVDTFTAAFPGVTVPAWIRTMTPTLIAAYNATRVTLAASGNVGRIGTVSFDAWIDALNAADPTPAPVNGHRYTGGSGADIARTQNAIYVAFAVSGIPYRDIPAAFGAAVWRFVLGRTRCDYASHTDYFVSTLSAFVAGRHNDTPGIRNADAERVVRVWRDAKPEPPASDTASDTADTASDTTDTAS